MTDFVTLDDLDFAGLVKPGDLVVCGQGSGEPVDLTARLMTQRSRIGGRFRLFLGVGVAGTFAPEQADHVHFMGYGALGTNSKLGAAGVLDAVPTHYSQLQRMFAEGWQKADVALLLLSPADAQGRHHTGLNHDYLFDAARSARLVIAEINENVPRTPGAELPPDIGVHLAVRTTRAMPELKAGVPNDIERRLAANVAAEVPEGATIELGVGTVPELVLGALGGHRRLGVHSGVVSDGMVDLIRSGAIDNSAKREDAGITIGGLLLGSRKLFDFADGNAALRLCPPVHTHGIEVLARLPRFTAINAALEVDLTGQINSEMAGTQIGALGGQVDFSRGGMASTGGRSIIALQATARKGAVNRIVAKLPDATVTTPRSDADVVVTEWGVAHLRGKSLGQRARALAAIAEPRFREELERASAALVKSGA